MNESRIQFMKISRYMIQLSAVLAWIGFSGSVFAVPVIVTASGPIDGATDNNIFPFNPGDRVSLTFSYDTDSPAIASGDTTDYGATATFEFGSSVFSGAAVIQINSDTPSGVEGFLVVPELTATGNRQEDPLSSNVNYAGPADLTEVLFSTGAFSWFDTRFPDGTFPNGELVVLPEDQLEFNIQNGHYSINTASGRAGAFMGYSYDTFSVQVVPEPSTTALILAAGMSLLWRRRAV